MKSKRIASGVLAGLMTLSVLSACSQKQPEEAKPQVTAEQEKTYTVNWLPQCDAPVDENSPVKVELEKMFNLKINFIYLERNKMTELLNLRVAAGEIPDVINQISVQQYKQYADNGVLSEVPLDTVKKVSPKMYDGYIKNSKDNLIWEYGKVNGKNYGVPVLLGSGLYAYVPIWRDDWLKNVGITKIPETLQEAEAAFYKFVNEDPDKNGKKDTYALSDKGFMPVYGALGTMPVDNNNGPMWLEKDGKLVYSATMPEAKEAYTLLNKWYKDGLIDPEFVTGENKGQAWANTVTFWNGKIGFSCPGMNYSINPPLSKAPGTAGSVNYDNFKKLQGQTATYVEGKPFKGPSGKSGTVSWGIKSGNYTAFGKNVVQQSGLMERLLKMIETLNEDEKALMLEMYGIEGTQITKVADGKYKETDEWMKKKIDDKLASSKLGMNANGPFGINYNLELKNKVGDYFKDENTIMTGNEYAEKVAKFASVYSNKVMAPLPSEAQIASELTKKAREEWMKFVIGKRSTADWDKYVEEMNKAGLEQLTKEANEWYASVKKK